MDKYLFDAEANIGFILSDTARLLRIDHLLDKSVSGLAGGDRQRVALGRAIVRRPKAFMMDEPLGALDAEFRELMCHELRALHSRLGATTVYVTHDQLEAMSMADKIAVMSRGVVEQCGTPQEIYDRPASMFVADFIGSPPMNFLRFAGSLQAGTQHVRVGSATVGIPTVREDHGEGELVLGVRPEHVRLSDTGPVRGEVFGNEYRGTTQIVAIRTAHGTVMARLPGDQTVRPGEMVGMDFANPRLSLFQARTGQAIRTALYEGGYHG